MNTVDLDALLKQARREGIEAERKRTVRLLKATAPICNQANYDGLACDCVVPVHRTISLIEAGRK